MLKRVDDMLLTIERENGEGEGIAFADGKAVFIPAAMIGDRIRAHVVKDAKKYRRAEITELIEPAAGRIHAPCPYFGVCGGCAMQHMAYARTLAQKQKRVADCLSRIGGIAPDSYELRPILGMAEPWRYRNKGTAMARDGRIGLYRMESHSVVPIEDCLLQPPAFAAALRQTRGWLRDGGGAASLLVRTGSGGDVLTLLTAAVPLRQAEAWAAALHSGLPALRGALWREDSEAQPRALFGEESIYDECCGIGTMVSAQSFRQVNPMQAEALYHEAISLARLDGSETVIDAYCGAGILTQLFAAKCRSAVGIEIVPEAIDEAKRAAAGRDNVHFLRGACERHLPGMRCDALVLDPPRKGCSPAVLRAALDANPGRIVYISCDPATLARDVKSLSQGGYRLACARPVDMFPWTAHVETMVLLLRIKESEKNSIKMEVGLDDTDEQV